jgi:hypothetical protein
VLRLELFERAALAAAGVVLQPTIAQDDALARGREPLAEIDLIQRDVLRAVLSLVYFPLWMVPSGGRSTPRVTVVDAVSGSIVARDADPAPLDALARGEAADRVLGFRALCCPNCGWDLPVRATDLVFHCTSCARTWELAGDELEQIASVVVARGPTAHTKGDVPFLPVWQVSGGVAPSIEANLSHVALPQRLFAPAFRWRPLKTLCDLGARLARAVPSAPEVEAARDVTLVGCALDRADAVVLARVIALRLLLDDARVRQRTAAGKVAPQVEIGDPQTKLVWLPFAGDAYSLREPFSGYALPRRGVQQMLA